MKVRVRFCRWGCRFFVFSIALMILALCRSFGSRLKAGMQRLHLLTSAAEVNSSPPPQSHCSAMMPDPRIARGSASQNAPPESLRKDWVHMALVVGDRPSCGRAESRRLHPKNCRWLVGSIQFHQIVCRPRLNSGDSRRRVVIPVSSPGKRWAIVIPNGPGSGLVFSGPRKKKKWLNGEEGLWSAERCQ